MYIKEQYGEEGGSYAVNDEKKTETDGPNEMPRVEGFRSWVQYQNSTLSPFPIWQRWLSFQFSEGYSSAMDQMVTLIEDFFFLFERAREWGFGNLHSTENTGKF